MLTGIKHSLLYVSMIISSFDFDLCKSLISRGKKKTLHHWPPCIRLMFVTIGQYIFLAKKKKIHPVSEGRGEKYTGYPLPVTFCSLLITNCYLYKRRANTVQTSLN